MGEERPGQQDAQAHGQRQPDQQQAQRQAAGPDQGRQVDQRGVDEKDEHQGNLRQHPDQFGIDRDLQPAKPQGTGQDAHGHEDHGAGNGRSFGQFGEKAEDIGQEGGKDDDRVVVHEFPCF